MLSSTVELITLWASSSPSLLAFCFSHLIIAVLLLGCRGECTPGAAEAKTLDRPRVQGGKRSYDRGQESPVAAASVVVVVELEHRRSCGPNVSDGRPKGCAAEVDTDAVQVKASEKSCGAEDGPGVDDTVHEKCGDGEEEDELMLRAEEFIQRMNRVWMTER